MIAFAGIDGTGTSNNDEYTDTFKDSFVNQLYRSWPIGGGTKYYHRGPHNDGFNTKSFATAAYNFIHYARRLKGTKAIFLAGYSRGAAAAIEVADWLWTRDKLEVECLILFDAVDRTNTLGSGYKRNGFNYETEQVIAIPRLPLLSLATGFRTNTNIPRSVKNVIHAKRDIEKSGSRESFGTWGGAANYEGPASNYVERHFNCTHGGVGGTPWTKGAENELVDEEFPDGKTKVTYKQDSDVSGDVKRWAFPKYNRILTDCRYRLYFDQLKSRPQRQCTF